MNKVAFIFSKSPYGNSSGQAGLDAIISISSFSEDIALFFTGDGIFQIVSNQKPKKILFPNYSISFNILSICNINNYFICYNSLNILGLKNFNKKNFWTVPIKIIDSLHWKKKLKKYNIILHF
ncbi:sulfurtransferase complex subunit TusC [Enterobacteriaceae endosymbiont of Plateumaris consimilis]|uniref:sulfurtransferase complex subunit TusC n=1 Tax=Enterobacteriaceae endosymbiont of Plateumaris consimilis TaxID=2675794 RepID=UPI00144927DC|nr:sulfurtransferase complex subunit TusC [Enterobacteriaceae endosymbiont of Plateumaris consimilis]QJC28733.1 sulfurtransferase complex subunit TusC [Enterobacteriaceae endosymbiont of Plateumaris consimilis]